MECNKDEALRAKELAETKLLQKDIVGAQKFAIKAQNLFPALKGLSQLIATVDVYACAEKRINGEVDFYRVLGVDPLADDETIKKNYRKLALNLHPDKNKSAGAEGAFKIVSEAWSLLSDKDKKAKYDQKRNLRAMYEKGFHSSTVNQQNTSNPQPTQVYPPHPSNSNMFWTSCIRCFMHYEYLRVYLHQRLLCPNCRQPFLAVEIRKPSGTHNTFTGWSSLNMQHQNSNHHAAANNLAAQPSSVTVRQGQPPKSSTGGSSVKSKRGREAETDASGEGAFHMKGKVDGSAKKRRVDEHKPNSTRELSQSETRVMLMVKARKEILKNLAKWDSDSKKQVKRVQKDNADKKDEVTGVRKEEVNHFSQHKQSSKPSVMDLDEEPPVFMSMAVPDPDFHDFDRDRTEKSFGQDEVWAVYDDDDGMPRMYALIHRLKSSRPFRVKMSWLNSKSNTELSPMNWVGSGFRKTCGKYHIGKHEVNRSLNAFSHRVRFTRAKGVIQIFPAKGNVWALYKNWAPDWNEHTVEDLVHKYEMVQVLEDYREEEGVTVVPLVKVSGFRSVFHQQRDLKEARKIPKEEIFRFSHQVPCYLLTGPEAEKVPEGSLELDPAALPSELLQII